MSETGSLRSDQVLGYGDEYEKGYVMGETDYLRISKKFWVWFKVEETLQMVKRGPFQSSKEKDRRVS